MPEDALIGFLFFTTENDLSIVNENARKNATEHLVNEVAFRNALEHLDNAKDAVRDATFRKVRGEEQEWPDNVPPDPGDTDDFFLL
ncbi:hypothetical protein [Falsiruegeria mediterranea]|jgi:hypothetical protein|uniref:Uncharacterized protein n=1 Tax=Falsiruegeria mediterranea M17 TaxID=1200281 RepID=A0A2R8C9P3_9RHOB|nr:hypothetical protein [Falsiruegeria mediterranea]SPJ29160.1 hypothetical protein TRM7615_02672 [Falsiruegeria mediterranea M17]